MPSNVVADARRGKKKSSPSGGSSLRSLWENIKSLAGALLIYLVINTLLIAAYRIPSGSMIPTLLIGDWLFVNKAVYGPHIPFTDAHLPSFSEPKRGEVVVFVSPYQADEAERHEDPTPVLVKRMVGMGGDTLYMRKGLLYVKALPKRHGVGIVSQPNTNSSQPTDTDSRFAWQHKFEVRQSRFGPPPADPQLDNWGPILIPTGHFFMMGDNRYESKDSRYWGVVPRENVRGRPSFVYYSYKGGGESDRPLPFITDIRWGRIGTRIH